jgi:hypothetical protein
MRNYYKVASDIERNRLGRPKCFDDEITLDKRLREYFDMCFEEGPDGKDLMVEKPTLTGLYMWLGLSSARAYQKKLEYNDKFGELLGLAKSAVLQYYEESLTGKSVPGAKFALAAMFGWTEKTENTIVSKDYEIDMTGLEDLPSLPKSKDKKDRPLRIVAG